MSGFLLSVNKLFNYNMLFCFILLELYVMAMVYCLLVLLFDDPVSVAYRRAVFSSRTMAGMLRVKLNRRWLTSYFADTVLLDPIGVCRGARRALTAGTDTGSICIPEPARLRSVRSE